MLIYHDPDSHETIVHRHTCPFHQVEPGKTFAGCTCSTSIGSRLRPAAEVREIKAKRRREEEDKILAQAEAIKASRAARPQPGGRDE